LALHCGERGAYPKSGANRRREFPKQSKSWVFHISRANPKAGRELFCGKPQDTVSQRARVIPLK